MGPWAFRGRGPRGHCLRRTGPSEQELIEVSVRRDRGADLARVVGLAPLDHVRYPPRLQELSDELRGGRVASFFLRRWVTALGQHALDQAIHLGQGFRRRVDDQRLEALPFGLPLVAIETRFDHENKMRAYDPFETLLA